MRDAITLFERELARRNGHTMMIVSSGFVGMMERDSEFIYDLLWTTPKNTDYEFDSEGSCYPLRECNTLHLLEDGAMPGGGAEDDTYPISRTPRE